MRITDMGRPGSGRVSSALEFATRFRFAALVARTCLRRELGTEPRAYPNAPLGRAREGPDLWPPIAHGISRSTTVRYAAQCGNGSTADQRKIGV